MSTQGAPPPLYTFSGYTLVPASRNFLSKAKEWTAADEHHSETTSGDFWVNTGRNNNPAVERYVLLDTAGEPVFFFRMTRAIRIDIQFAPGQERSDLVRNSRALICGFSWLRWICQKSHIGQMIFQTANAPLRRFCERKLGFHMTSGECVFGMESLVSAESPKEIV
jgi:hypothetical protein